MIDESELLQPTTAQRRWRLLARALSTTSTTGSSSSGSTSSSSCCSSAEEPEELDPVSTRRFEGFGLLRARELPVTTTETGTETETVTTTMSMGTWCEYQLEATGQSAEVLLRARRCFSPDELIGFNNTGNVCVWPSEECLAHYLLRRPELTRGKRVLELGGGMSCLAGLLAAKYGGCARGVALTDGNATSVDNVQRIIGKNRLEDEAYCAVLEWGSGSVMQIRQKRPSSMPHHREYDLVLCADCLFFDESRLELLATIDEWLADGGLALVMAPRRGDTFRSFTEAAIERGGLKASFYERYDEEVWARHCELLSTSPNYCPDVHYPLLLELRKSPDIKRGTADGQPISNIATEGDAGS